ncbi:hypothetical protein OKW43_002072 [Paraburkholderia sp. WC7.3g]|uniref:hypothetical protein n=1 Tax=Paraburkholderia sp. WC7.3g TaxID=2991070 RepID=UPI003D2249CD
MQVGDLTISNRNDDLDLDMVYALAAYSDSIGTLRAASATQIRRHRSASHV